MINPPTLLPPSSTPLEREISRTTGRFSPAQSVPSLWNAATCPPDFLPHLAWSLSVDEWDHGWSVDKKRAVIAAAIEIHRRKGTPLAIRRALESLGQADADLIERADCIKHNGVARRNGWHRRLGQAGWATYRINLKRPVTVDQATMIKRLLSSVSRNCVHLVAIDYSQAAIRRNGVAPRNGSYTRGVVAAQL